MTRLRWTNPPKEADPARAQPYANSAFGTRRGRQSPSPARLDAQALMGMANRLRQLKVKKGKAERRLAELIALVGQDGASPTKQARRQQDLDTTTLRHRRLLDEIDHLTDAYNAGYREVFSRPT